MLELREVTKIFNPGRPNEFTALDGISLDIPLGATTALKGPSGSGKTTLLSIIGCMARPTSGTVHLDGELLSSLPERHMAHVRRKTFGFVFQSFNLIKGLTALENILVPALPLGEPRSAIQARADDLLERFRIASKAGQKVESLSGGEKQRVAVARALVNNPRILIADEPTAHLDTALAGEFLAYLGELAAEGRTILLSSHDPLALSSGFIGHTAELRDGRVVGAAR